MHVFHLEVLSADSEIRHISQKFLFYNYCVFSTFPQIRRNRVAHLSAADLPTTATRSPYQSIAQLPLMALALASGLCVDAKPPRGSSVCGGRAELQMNEMGDGDR